ncbi:hypothetical protein ACKUB1_13800 [Methanospirillum stamsii]|uniref:Uncharacterized protein n=1 Tax=Methanospirillum stamsii TaxID=1277351 RepID=A0A2V2NGT2_9EURY|nr:hypothetical protein [Methanospirillum stamsii]PWR74821.1 hypothetical protein DLD82_07955 [Methanospirillum stamsii]
MIKYTPDQESPLAKLWPDGVTGELATVQPTQAHLRVKLGEGKNTRHLSLLVPWQRCEVVR